MHALIVQYGKLTTPLSTGGADLHSVRTHSHASCSQEHVQRGALRRDLVPKLRQVVLHRNMPLNLRRGVPEQIPGASLLQGSLILLRPVSEVFDAFAALLCAAVCSVSKATQLHGRLAKPKQ